MFNEVESDSNKKNKIIARIKRLEKRYNDMEYSFEKMDLKERIKHEMIVFYDSEIKNRSLVLSKENAVFVQLKKTSKTIEMIDMFLASYKPFMVLDRLYYVNSNGLKSISLVVAEAYSFSIHNDGNDLTMTDIKLSSGNMIREKAIPYMDKKDRKIALYKKILDATKTAQSNGFIPFKRAQFMGAQCSNNRTGYGSEYCGYELIHEGTYYGETTPFAIIGLIIN